MLIEFSVSNFRSIRERQTFSMVAAPRLQKKANTFQPTVNGERLPRLLKVAAIYGPNASGKSNLLLAFNALSDIVGGRRAALQTDLPVSGFRFDPALVTAASNFEIHFISDGMRYELRLSATVERITYESLIAYPSGKETLYYERRHTESGDAYSFGTELEGGQVLHDAWRQLTGPRSLFLSQAVANSSEELTQLRKPHKWLDRGVKSIGGNLRGWAKSSQEIAQESPEVALAISEFLQEIDVPVTNIRFESDARPAVVGLGLARANSTADTDSKQKPRTKTTLIHSTALGSAEFDFSEESDGTKALIGFWLPWQLLGAGQDSIYCTLLVDELDSSLHPLIVEALVSQHINNEKPSQLIFTTHDTHLMDTKLLRRDQLWLTERDKNGATSLRSIHDFEGREAEDIEKRYYEGKYRGLPFVRTRRH